MEASIPAYNRYAKNVLMPAMNQTALAEIKDLEAAHKFDDPRYEELLMQNFYVEHFLRMPAEHWPDPVLRSLNKLNKKIYVPMQGPSELGASGKLVAWDRTADLPRITVPTLSIGARYDTMEPAEMQRIAKSVKKGRYLFCPNGSHLDMYDDQDIYMNGLIQFILDVDARRF
jgi:proline iminopeptidase